MLEKSKKKPTLAFSGKINPKYSFLDIPQNFVQEITGARDFVLSFDTSRNVIDNVRWEKGNKHLNIYVTPEKGSIDPRDFSFVLARFKYDLVIVIGSPDLESLGDIYLKNTDLFFEVPVVNIDNKTENDSFGKINLVDVTSSSCSELIFSLLDKKQIEDLSESCARNLLTGIISATNRFQKRNTTPKTFYIASQLMAKGADQQEVIRWLYKTQPLPLLKLWGRAMAKLSWQEELSLAWSHLSVRDFVESRANPEMLDSIMEKLQENYNEGKIFMLLYNDTPKSSIALIRTSEKENLRSIQDKLQGKRKNGSLEISLPIPDLREASQEIRGKLI